MQAAVQVGSRFLVSSALCGPPRQPRTFQVASRRLIVAEGERTQQGEASTSTPPSPPSPSVRVPPQQQPRVRVPPPSPYGDNVQIEKVESLGESRFSGVVALDSGNTPDNWGRVTLLAGGDIAVLLLFATIGRVSHGETISLSAAFGTAWPFITGCLASGYLLGGYGKAAQGGDTLAAAAAGAKTWALGIPAGLLLRSATRGYFPDPSFIAVSLAVNGVLLVGWRSALAAVTPQAAEPVTPLEQLKARKNRQGSPLEMLQMVFSMVKRW